MTRYFFNLLDSENIADETGIELPDLGIAKGEAIRFLAALLKDSPHLAADGRHLAVEVTDAAGEVLFTTVSLSLDRTKGLNPQGAPVND